MRAWMCQVCVCAQIMCVCMDTSGLCMDMSGVRMDTPALAAHCSAFPKLPTQCSWDFEPQNPRQSQVSAHQPALGPAVVPPPWSHASLGAQVPSAPPSLAAGA